MSEETTEPKLEIVEEPKPIDLDKQIEELNRILAAEKFRATTLEGTITQLNQAIDAFKKAIAESVGRKQLLRNLYLQEGNPLVRMALSMAIVENDLLVQSVNEKIQRLAHQSVKP